MVYLDHGATTPVHKEIIRSLASWGEDFSCEIFFTSGDTEGDNWILNSWHETTSKEHIIITDNIEHAAVMNTCSHLAKTYGRDVVTLNVDETDVRRL